MKWTVVIALMLCFGTLSASAQRRAGGGAARTRSAPQVNRNVANTSIRSNQDVSRSANLNRDVNVNRSTDVNRNVNIDRDIEVDRDIDIDAGYDRWGHPIARGAAYGAAAGVAAAATSALLGSTVAVLPANCTTVIVNGIGYSQCGSTWYEPHYSGTTVQYTVVNPQQ
jgi:hypothetical protein